MSMHPDEKANWLKIKEHFETLSEESRESMFYKRACLIVDGSKDPLQMPGWEPTKTEEETDKDS